MQLSLPYTYQQLFLFVLVFSRASAFLMTFPVFGSPEIQDRTRIIFAVIISIVMFRLIGEEHPPIPESFYMIGYFAALEVIKGLLMGFIGRLILSSINLGMQLLGQNMGLSMANLFDPMTQQQVSIVERFYILFYLVLFLQLNVHHDVLVILRTSYTTLPFGPFALRRELFEFIVSNGTYLFVLALKIAAPIMVTVTLSNIIMGVIVRTAPQMNIYFAVGMFSNIIVGFLILIVSLPYYNELFKFIMRDTNDSLRQLLKLMSVIP